MDIPIPGSPPLSEYRAFRELQPELRNIFPSIGALEWDLRTHRVELIQAGALIEIGRRYLVHPGLYQKALRERGTRAAAARAGIQGGPT